MKEITLLGRDTSRGALANDQQTQAVARDKPLIPRAFLVHDQDLPGVDMRLAMVFVAELAILLCVSPGHPGQGDRINLSCVEAVGDLVTRRRL